MKKLFLGLGLALSVHCLGAESLTIQTTASSDGSITDNNNDAIADKVTSTLFDSEKENAVLGITNSLSASETTKSAFEFKVPEEVKGTAIKEAKLIIGLNWGYDSEKKRKGQGPELQVWGYHGKNADGTISLNDFNAGEDINVSVKRDHQFKKKRFLELNVTGFVNKAIESNANFIGLRLDPKKMEDDPATLRIWKWRSCEFGQKHDKQYIPKLKITYGQGKKTSAQQAPPQKITSVIQSKIKKTSLVKNKTREMSAAYKVYPNPSLISGSSGGLNPRVPVVPPTNGIGALNSSAVNIQGVVFSYDLSGYVNLSGQYDLVFFLRQDKRPGTNKMLSLDNNRQSMKLLVKQYPGVRKILLTYTENSKTVKEAVLDIPYATEWRNISISFKNGHVLFDNKPVLEIAKNFIPETLQASLYNIDELRLTGKDCEVVLDWEKDYAAQVKTTNLADAIKIRSFGFDTMVISLDPDKRDCPIIQISNNTDDDQTVKIDFSLNSEVNKLKQEFSQSVSLPAGTQKEFPIEFSSPLQSDIYHLDIKAPGINERKHFLYVERRGEKPGEHKFGLHDYGLRNFGFWPDALPVNVAHKYLRWFYVAAYPWNPNPDGTRGLPEGTPTDEWLWNIYLDWVVQQKNLIPYVCVQSGSGVDWMIDKNNPGPVKKAPWGGCGVAIPT